MTSSSGSSYTDFDDVMRQLNNYEDTGPSLDFLSRELEVGEKAEEIISVSEKSGVV
jgi:hypothetical protein